MSKRSHSDTTDTVIPLDNKKQVTVRKFNNINLVDIREFYIDKNTQEKKPGKKGISLTEEVWKKLMAAREDIDDALNELNGKKRMKGDDSEKGEESEKKEESEKSEKTEQKNGKFKSDEKVTKEDDESEEE